MLLAWLRALNVAAIETRADILFVASVGEEGAGDLRGMRYLFTQGRYKDRIGAFITVDSPEMDRIVTGGVGSKRYRVTFHGPGGTASAHSAWSIRCLPWQTPLSGWGGSTCPLRRRPRTARA